MPASAMSKMIGKTAQLDVGGMTFLVKIVDARSRWGRPIIWSLPRVDTDKRGSLKTASALTKSHTHTHTPTHNTAHPLTTQHTHTKKRNTMAKVTYSADDLNGETL